MGPCGPEGPVSPCGPGGPCSPSVPLCPGSPSLPGSPGMIGNVAALAQQVLDFAVSVVRYTAVKIVRDTRSLTVRGSIFGDNSICSLLPCQLVLIRLDHAIVVPRPVMAKETGNNGGTAGSQSLWPLAHASALYVCSYVCMICIYSRYVCMSI